MIASFAFSYALKENMNKNSILFKIYDKLVYSKFREIFGSRVEKLVSGGAPLSKEIAQFFVNIGIPIYQGYGMTEFSPVVSTNYPNANKVGSCGKVIPSTKIKITQNNELLVRGDSLMLGYLNQEELTNKTIDSDGWLHTGDVARVDNDGYLFITSRIKEIFKTSTGEYVNAVEIEQKISKNRYIEFAVVIAQNRKFTTALLFVDKEKFENAKKLNKNLTIEEYYNKDDILRNISNHISSVNSTLNKWEKIVSYKILTNDISIETGELTPSMKISRNKIEEKYANIINSMY
jgi:long-chain acyl-CoA synthetase